MLKVNLELAKRKEELCQLWLNYHKMLAVAQALITADRNGSWLLHLSAVADCLPIFAAAGHYNYLKSVHFYIHYMEQLETTHPDVYWKFLNAEAISTGPA